MDSVKKADNFVQLEMTIDKSDVVNLEQINYANETKYAQKQVTMIHKGSYSLFLKRIFDIILSLFAIIILSPVMLVVAILIKLDSKGPVIYKHKRIGCGRTEFDVYKFRSMVIDSQNLDSFFTPEQLKEYRSSFKVKGDPRVTKLGSILRKSSLDELPQLFNILNGSMSLVGPRPIVLAELDKYGQYSGYYLSAKPGLTGLWQANGRSDTSYAQRVQLDVEYVKNINFWTDFKIILNTFVVVFKKIGAY